MSLKMEQGFQEYPVLRDIIEMVEEGYVNRVPKHHFPAARSPIFDPKGSHIHHILGRFHEDGKYRCPTDLPPPSHPGHKHTCDTFEL